MAPNCDVAETVIRDQNVLAKLDEVKLLSRDSMASMTIINVDNLLKAKALTNKTLPNFSKMNNCNIHNSEPLFTFSLYHLQNSGNRQSTKPTLLEL